MKRAHLLVVLMAIITMILFVQPSGAATLAGLWRFDEGTGPTVADESGESVAGQISGATWITDDPERGTVLEFDGVDDLVTIDDFVTELSHGSFTIAFWAKLPVGNGGALIAKDDGDAGWDGGEKQLWFGDGSDCCDGEFPGFVGNQNAYLISDTALGIPGWHHVALVWTYDPDGVSSGAWYVDGNETGLGVSSYQAITADNPSDTVKIGPDISNEAEHNFNGLLDDLAFFNDALTSSEVIQVMGGEFSSFTVMIFANDFESGDTSRWDAVVGGV